MQIVYCAASSVAFTAEYTRTESTGVSYIARSWLDSKYRAARRAKTYSDAVKNMLAHFADPATQDQWDVLFCGPVDPREVSYRGKDTANCLISEDGKRLAFIGATPLALGVSGVPCAFAASACSLTMGLCALLALSAYARWLRHVWTLSGAGWQPSVPSAARPRQVVSPYANRAPCPHCAC